MTSNNPLDIMDDEEFDWEAAAREIDVVCEMASDAQGKGKQQTGLKKESPTPQFEEDDENPTFVHHIDAEAAKTWIYPVNVRLRD